MTTCTRTLAFDAAHRVMRHESKCAHLHGHRYLVEVTAGACAPARLSDLDDIGRVVDFSVIKERVGTWIDDKLDHGTLVNEEDTALVEWLRANNQKHMTMVGNPTAENIAACIMFQSGLFLRDTEVRVTHVRVYETPNCWADVNE